ncbi:helix-turn-helix domain-containing protein [Caldalkalibacillus thermarum TA2.A1]|uniref:Helix-turn-helix domain-containing protein n=2 Tax=Caldalkalibacillus TaxID=379065 RepID=A0A8X8I729_CALTT|nr:helix-turn-helix domain-containing protein [Caldalkalibacillus thermarum TA2.A1]
MQFLHKEVIKVDLNVAPLLKALREKAGLSQEELADKLNWSQSCVSRLESGKKKRVELQEFISWINATNAPEVAVAYIFGMDGITILQNILQLVSCTLPLIAV